MCSELAVVDISSDEEGEWNDKVDAPIDWLSELLNCVDNEAEESDDVVVVDELSCASIQKQNHTPSNTVKGITGDESDDECLILDGDPDNPVAVVDDAGNGSDDILIVGEKGQIACRDYPHPRHLCAKFPFSSTPHEKHCHLCHCYVCEERAPCIYWVTGISTTGHCHSTDKEEIWKAERKCFKQGNMAAPPVRKLPDTTLSITPSWHNPEPTLPLPQSRNVGSIPLQASVSKSTHLRVCSTSFGPPNIISHRHSQHSRPMHGRHRLAPYPNRSQPLVPGTHAISRERGGNLGPQFGHQHLKVKRVEPARRTFSTGNRSGYGPSNSNRAYTATQSRTQTPQVVAREDVQQRRWQDLLTSIDSELSTFEVSTHPNSNGSFGDFHLHTVPPQPQAYGGQSNMDPNTYQFGNLAPGGTHPNPLDFDYNWTPQLPLSMDPTSPSMQPSVPHSCTQTDHAHLGSASGSSEFHPESWYPLEHQPGPEAAMEPLGFSLPQTMEDDLLYGYEEYMGHLERVT
ncbi:uncharacterized protein LOC131245767 [Magnolia sinica]|uniref:uncharacterized protein LOC131245767 n=1 Tax=Magnolia sinica TaxID=86752 RepID=UPI00265AF29D|nr:uncharacterized protein LOC131245767 [Magnolia sinica]